MELKISNLNKKYDGVTVYSDFSLSIPRGLITCILGPSGCGKTTLLNIIGGITQPDGGTLSGFEGTIMSYIFQDPRLLPWKTIRGNIELVIDRKIAAGERRHQADNLIRLVGLDDFADHYPAQLSGGMRQRVSIARAFACPSDIILMDEPLKGLDIALKHNMIRWFTRLWTADRRTVIFVTHDVDEALMLGEEIFVMSSPPVHITTHISFDTPLDQRDSESAEYNKLKQKLIKGLGHSSRGSTD